METAIVQTQAPEANFLSVVARAAADPTIDVTKMQALLAMQKEILSAQAEASFNAAMNACQKEMPQVVKNKKGENNKYATLEQVDATVRPIYAKHGFSLSFGSKPLADGIVTVTCRLSHCAEGAIIGHSVDYELSGAIDTSGPQGKATKTGIQGMGSTTSYLRRYLLCMIFNIAVKDEDNDGARARFITPAQVEAIEAALGGQGDRVAGFCDRNGLRQISELDASSFDAAMAQIRKANAARTQVAQ
ncbi:MAG: ERF family protein [Aquamicrobium sp.]|nr:ERF family protein [Aquamicrobium sp.]